MNYWLSLRCLGSFGTIFYTLDANCPTQLKPKWLVWMELTEKPIWDFYLLSIDLSGKLSHKIVLAIPFLTFWCFYDEFWCVFIYCVLSGKLLLLIINWCLRNSFSYFAIRYFTFFNEFNLQAIISLDWKEWFNR